MMKSAKSLLFTTALCCSAGLHAQTETISYDDFEGSKSVHYGQRSGVLDTAANNPAPNKVNSSSKCAMYVRNGSKKFDNIKMSVIGKLADVSPFATYTGIPPKLKMKIYTSAPAGTLIEILLGSKGRNNEYPAGTNSQYQAHTTKTNTWEEIEFLFSQIPEGSETGANEVDQVTLLFNPNTLTSDTYYFDDVTGPALFIPDNSEPIVTPAKITNDTETDTPTGHEKTREHKHKKGPEK